MVTSTGTVHPGQSAAYTMNVYPANARADDVTVTLSVTSGNASPSLPAPAFSVCGNGDGTQTCTLGSLRENQVTQLEAEVAVPSDAASGDSVTLAVTATAEASGATQTGSVSSSATSDVVAPSPSPTPTPTPPHSSGHSGGSGSDHSSGSGTNGSTGSGGTTADDQPLNDLPPLLSSGGSAGTTASGGSSSSDLFPTINPSSSPGSGGSGRGKAPARPYRATTVADVLPLNHGLLNTQIAALIVLALGIVLVFARISLRKPRGSGGHE